MKQQETYNTVPVTDKDLGPGSAGQSGDTQGLSNLEDSDSESVVELLEEGQSFEAAAISGEEEETPDGEVAELHPKQFPEDDVPSEYLDRD
jgi:hypothetical protein